MNSKVRRKAPFIVLEGIDGAGTTTQAGLLCARLGEAGQPCLATREPTDGPVGRLIRAYLRGDYLARPTGPSPLDPGVMTHLFAADRNEHLRDEVLPALVEGTLVVSDRYFYSTVAYQAVGTDADWVLQTACRVPPPDIAFLLDIDPELGLARITGRPVTELYEKRDFLTRVRANYLNYFGSAPEVRIMDAGRSREDLAEEIFAEVDRLIRERF